MHVDAQQSKLFYSNLTIIILDVRTKRPMKNFLVISILLVISIHAYGRKVKGEIIANGKLREVTFDIKVPLLVNEPNFHRLQYKIRYYDEAGKKQTLRPHDADEIRFDYEGREVRMISCPNTLGNGNIFSTSTRIFLKLEIDGPLRLYRHYYKESTPGFYTGGTGGFSGGTTYIAENLIFQKGNGPLKQPKTLGWKKDMLDYFSDCPGLRERIDNKDLRRKEIEAIVIYYNQNCGQR